MAEGTMLLSILLAVLFSLWIMIWEPRTRLVRKRREELDARDNPFASLREIDMPYAIYLGVGGREWRILKTYNSPAAEARNRYARWLVAVKSHDEGVNFDVSDTYAMDILTYGRLFACTKVWLAKHGKRSSVAHDVQMLG